jgi:hypothetical protein
MTLLLKLSNKEMKSIYPWHKNKRILAEQAIWFLQ